MNTEAAAARDADARRILKAMRDQTLSRDRGRTDQPQHSDTSGGDLWNAMTVMRVMKRLGITGK